MSLLLNTLKPRIFVKLSPALSTISVQHISPIQQKRGIFFSPLKHQPHFTPNPSVYRKNIVTITSTKSSQLSENDDNINLELQPMNEMLEISDSESNRDGIPALIVSPSCVRRIKQLASKQLCGDDQTTYLRVFVDPGGCSGFEYKFELSHDETEIDQEEDIIFANDGARVVVDTESLDILRGSTIDFVQDMMRSSFSVVDNPQSESACGCGSSFAVKNFDANPDNH